MKKIVPWEQDRIDTVISGPRIHAILEDQRADVASGESSRTAVTGIIDERIGKLKRAYIIGPQFSLWLVFGLL
ncbi:MAG: hypothetical protein ACRERU_04040 [Methylococcales bacterium]